MGARRNEAEQNRLITANMGIVGAVVADFRGRGVDFEDLLAIGREGLFEASITYDEAKGPFASWASIKIRSRVHNEILSGRHHLLGEEPEPPESLRIEKIYEHDNWGNGGNARAITELWPPSFDSSPEELAMLYGELKDKQAKFDAAFISLSPLERKLVTLVFLRDPGMGIADAAREIGISFLKTARTLRRALAKMRKVILSMEVNAREAEAA